MNYNQEAEDLQRIADIFGVLDTRDQARLLGYAEQILEEQKYFQRSFQLITNQDTNTEGE